MAEEALTSRLLVAAPTLVDPNFFRTVVLVLEHGGEGALGVVLNRPSETDLAGALPQWAHLVGSPPVVFVGGPVAPGAAICLARRTPAEEGGGWKPVVGPVGMLDLNLDPDDVVPRVDEIRVFAGYAGWGPGQLEGEIDGGGWIVVDAWPGDALSERPDGLWSDVLRRQGGKLGLLANYPVDPALN